MTDRIDASEVPPEIDPDLGPVIRTLREKAGLSCAELASRSGLDIATLTAVEAGAADTPWQTAEAIASGLKMPFVDLVTTVWEYESGRQP